MPRPIARRGDIDLSLQVKGNWRESKAGRVIGELIEGQEEVLLKSVRRLYCV